MIYTGLPALNQHKIPSGATVSKVKCTICSQYMFLGMLAKEQVVCCSIASRSRILSHDFTGYVLLQPFPMRWVVIFWPWLALSISWERADQQMQTSCIADIRCWNTQCSIKVIKEGCNIKGRILYCTWFVLLDLHTDPRKDQIMYALVSQIGTCYTLLVHLYFFLRKHRNAVIHFTWNTEVGVYDFNERASNHMFLLVEESSPFTRFF